MDGGPGPGSAPAVKHHCQPPLPELFPLYSQIEQVKLFVTNAMNKFKSNLAWIFFFNCQHHRCLWKLHTPYNSLTVIYKGPLYKMKYSPGNCVRPFCQILIIPVPFCALPFASKLTFFLYCIQDINFNRCSSRS